MAQTPKVLLVDDEPTILLSLSHSLQGNGALVTRCRERRAAEEALRRERFHLAIIDLCLSGGGHPDGLEVVRAARQADASTDVIVMTAFGTDDLRRQALEHGATGYLSKPVSLDLLLTVVDRLKGRLAKGG